MNIDFHHAATYVLARQAGFSHEHAEKIAYSCQYVDDATNSGVICFTNGSMYERKASAHKMLDYRNFEELSNHYVWLPFHFLPGNGGLPAEKNPEGSFIHKIICKPNSYIALDMVDTCIRKKNLPFSLQLLGITMHVYADTWAHQGFAGVIHDVNHVYNLLDGQGNTDSSFQNRIKNFFGNLFDHIQNRFVDQVSPLGHGAALSYPDRPYLRWSYTDGLGRKIFRNNPDIFIEAADHVCQAMQKFIEGHSDAKVAGLNPKEKNKIYALFTSLVDENEENRHKEWLKFIKEGYFGFGAASLSYLPKGENSWKHKAIGTTKFIDEKHDTFQYKPSFLQSDWKLFHDALKTHRLDMINLILPRYGICAA